MSGGLYLSLGLHAEATRIFDRLLAGPVPQSVSDRAHFYLARIGYQRGYLAEAWRSLEPIRGPLPGELEPERRLLAANVLMEQGRYGEVANALADWNDESLASRYGRFNLGVALIRIGESAHGTMLLEDLGTRDAATEEERALRDRANLALGFALAAAACSGCRGCRAEPRAARRTRSRAARCSVSAGPNPTRNVRSARSCRGSSCADRKLLDASVQESYLAVPYAYAQLASNGRGGSALSVCGGCLWCGGPAHRRVHRRDRDAAGSSTRSSTQRPTSDRPAGSGSSSSCPTRRRRATSTICSHRTSSRKDSRTTATCASCAATSRSWQLSLEAFDDMIAARERAAAERTPRKDEMLATVDIESLAQRCGELDSARRRHRAGT